MDTYCLAGRSALEFWFRESLPYGYSRGAMEPLAERLASMGLSYAAPMERLCAVPPVGDGLRGLLNGVLHGLSEPLEFLVGSGGARRRTPAKTCSVWSRPVPYGALVAVGSGLLVSSPEFAFMQLARGASPAQFVMLGHELCAGYVASSADARGFRTCPPLSSTQLLTRFVDSCKDGARGFERYEHLLKCVHDASASPMESKLSTRLALPRTAGGYGLAGYELNAHVEVAPVDAGPHAKPQSFYPDLLWRNKMLVVEYDSDQFHTGARRIDEDTRRRNILQAAGYTVLTVTKQQMYDVEAFHKVGLQIAEYLGLRIQPKRSSYDWESRRRALGEELMEYRTSWV